MKIIAIKNMSKGNETIGEMWQETKIFEHTDNLFDVIKWLKMQNNKNITLSIPENEMITYMQLQKNNGKDL